MEVYLVGRSAAKRGMRPDGIVEADVSADTGASLGDRGVGVEVHLLVFHRAPEALHEHIVAPAAFAVYADGDLLAQENGGERGARELRALVAVEDRRLAGLCALFGHRFTVVA